KAEAEPKLPGKLVDLDRVVDERPPDESDKIAEFDSRVDKEVRAPAQRPEPGAAPRRPGDHPDAEDAPPSLLHPRQASKSERPSAGASERGESELGEGADAPAVDVDRADDGRAATDP